MRLVLLKGLPGCGKSTIGRALSKQLGWPLIDKDDIKDVLSPYVEGAGGYSYDIMMSLARRQLLQGLNVICDSPLLYAMTYKRAQVIASEAGADLVLVECHCSDTEQWRQRIDSRKTSALVTHSQVDWEKMADYRRAVACEANYEIRHPLLMIDTVRDLETCVGEIVEWLEQETVVRIL